MDRFINKTPRQENPLGFGREIGLLNFPQPVSTESDMVMVPLRRQNSMDRDNNQRCNMESFYYRDPALRQSQYTDISPPTLGGAGRAFAGYHPNAYTGVSTEMPSSSGINLPLYRMNQLHHSGLMDSDKVLPQQHSGMMHQYQQYVGMPHPTMNYPSHQHVGIIQQPLPGTFRQQDQAILEQQEREYRAHRDIPVYQQRAHLGVTQQQSHMSMAPKQQQSGRVLKHNQHDVPLPQQPAQDSSLIQFRSEELAKPSGDLTKKAKFSADENQLSTVKHEYDKEKNIADRLLATTEKKVALVQSNIPGSELRVLTGPIEKIIKWNKILQELDLPCLYEIIAKCVSVKRGRWMSEQLILLRDRAGPVLQASYYEIDFLLPSIAPGANVRVVGRMVGSNRLQAFSVRPAIAAEEASLPHLASICQHVVTKLQSH